MAIDGILNLDKPSGRTSFGVVAAVRKASGERRVGHGGTLDPQATGVLPILLGQATKVADFLAGARKQYRAEIELGISTDTYDSTGKTTATGDPSCLTGREVEEAAASFLGSTEQIPPMYSAIKQNGIPLYRWARAGVDLPRRSRKVEFSRIDVVEWRLPLLVLEVECSKGTYIRSFAHDLGGRLGCGAHLRNLVRLSSGPFRIEDAVSLSKAEEAFVSGCWRDIVWPIDTALQHLPAVTVGEEDEMAIVNGRQVLLEASEVSWELCRAYSNDGRFLAILRCAGEAGAWRPAKVFAARIGKA